MVRDCAWVCVVAGIALLVAAGVGSVESSDYQVYFGSPGDGCTDNELVIDVDTGSRLACVEDAAWRSPLEDRSYGATPFSDAEVDRILERSRHFAARGGLSSADKAELEQLVDDIRAGHGEPARPSWRGNMSFELVLGASFTAAGAILVIASRRPRS